jgi:hypothetical protein
VPPVSPGAQVLGSALPSAGVGSVDCDGRTPGGSSPACTVVQTRLPGRLLVAPRDGVIRSWQVRGARGELALQVLRRQGGRFAVTARSGYEEVPDDGLHVLPAQLPIRAGQVVGVEITPGAAIGVRTDVRAPTARWFGPLIWDARTPDRGAGSGFDHELLLRVEYMPGAKWSPPAQLTGPAAERAPAGNELVRRNVEVRGGRVRTVALVRLGNGVAFDLFEGERRLARLLIADADPRGGLVTLAPYSEPVLRLRWRNPDGRTIGNDYAVGARSIAPRT